MDKPSIPAAKLTSFEVTVPERPVFTDWDDAVELAKLSRAKVVNRTFGEPRYLLADFTVNDAEESAFDDVMSTGEIMKHLYLRADEIKPGDLLTDVSRFPVTRVIVHPNSHVMFRFQGTEFTRTARFGGPEYGYECFQVFRPRQVP